MPVLVVLTHTKRWPGYVGLDGWLNANVVYLSVLNWLDNFWMSCEPDTQIAITSNHNSTTLSNDAYSILLLSEVSKSVTGYW